jgi:diketogulonate reductase-like aldo/keto reductase
MATMGQGPSLTRTGFLRLCAGTGAALLAPRFPATGAAPERMLARPIPASGEALPIVGLGTWQTFDVGGSSRARAPLADVLQALFEHGGTAIDSSPMYGRSEGVVGDLLAGMDGHRRAFIATKVWTEGRERGVRQMNDSMRLLRTGRLDLMQIHNLVDWRTHMASLREWQQDGRIRYVGITHYTNSAFDSLEQVIAATRPDFVQFPYSIGVRAAETRLLPLCAERGVAVLVNRPYEAGGLFRKVRRRELPDWAADFDAASWGQFLLKYILAHPAVTCVIPGTSKAKHMADNAGAGHGRMPDGAVRRRMIELVESL